MIASTSKRLKQGASAAVRGCGRALANREVLRAYLHMAAALFASITVLTGVGIWALIALTPIGEDAAWWVIALLWAVRVAGGLLVVLVSPIVALTIINLLFPFLGERVFYSALALVDPARAAELRARPGLSFSEGMSDAMHRLALFFGMSVLAFLFSLVPVVGSIGGPVLQTYLTSRAVGWEMLDPYFDKLGMRFDDQRRFFEQHRPALVGFGLPISLLMAIPIVGPLLFGLAQASAALLVGEVLEAQAES